MANILIVEDNASLSSAYSSFLTQENHIVEVINNVDDALAYLATTTPDLILLDMLLPKKNGLNLLTEYDIVTKHPTVKVIAMSNYTEERIKIEAEKLGVKIYLTKAQLVPTELVNIINGVLSPN